MKVGLVTTSVSREAGGLLDATRYLAQAIHDPPNLDMEIIGLEDRYTSADIGGWSPLSVKTFAVLGPESWGFSRGLGRFLDGADIDVVHTHGLWMYPSVVTLRWARRRRGALVISPHGMLDPWALNSGGWKKKLVHALVERAHLRAAACLHALSEAEVAAIRALGLTNPICVIPNAIHLPSGAQPVPDWRAGLPPDARILLYLGRLHVTKGLAPLIEAWAGIDRDLGPAAKPWHLVIAGWDQFGCEADLRARVAALGAERVSFLGPQFGAAKDATYAAADAFVLPSFSEGLPMVVLEAWSHGLPVLMTRACNLPVGFAADAAIEITSEPRDIAQGLGALIRSSEEDRRAMGARGRVLVARQFSWDAVARDMRAVYGWLAGSGARPATVV